MFRAPFGDTFARGLGMAISWGNSPHVGRTLEGDLVLVPKALRYMQPKMSMEDENFEKIPKQKRTADPTRCGVRVAFCRRLWRQ